MKKFKSKCINRYRYIIKYDDTGGISEFEVTVQYRDILFPWLFNRIRTHSVRFEKQEDMYKALEEAHRVGESSLMECINIYKDRKARAKIASKLLSRKTINTTRKLKGDTNSDETQTGSINISTNNL